MVSIRTIFWFYLILVTEVILSSSSHPDCNHKKVVDQLMYMCNAYSTPYSSIKRETNSDDGFGPPNYRPPPSPPGLNDNNGQPYQQLQEIQIQSNPQNPSQGEQVNQQQQQQHQVQVPSSNSHRQWQAQAPHNNQHAPSEGSELPGKHKLSQPRRERLHPVSDPNEPEDFASFNDYYLNPVYADADWQSSIERWRRNPHIKDEIWRFVRNKCCLTGCTFPDEYWELDKRVNICGLR